LRDYGTVSLGDALGPAIELAEEGTPLTVFDRQMFAEHGAALNAEGRRIFLAPDGVPAVGALVVQRGLAATLRTIAREGIQAFYAGEIADAIVGDLGGQGGLLTREDLRAYPPSIEWAEPIETHYRDVQVFAPPPPSSAVQILETLNCIDAWQLGTMPHLGAKHLGVIAGASRLARLDTDRFVADPAVVTVPVECLLSPEHATELRARMQARTPSAHLSPPDEREGRAAAGGASTTHLAACDASGLAVNITQSLGRGFGSGVVVRDTGLVLNNALNWASVVPTHPNVIATGKRHEWPALTAPPVS
jgi:gamma-glutamyltranspeptidase/glutathione hydrolase